MYEAEQKTIALLSKPQLLLERPGRQRQHHSTLRLPEKPPKVALTACMRKLLAMLNAMLRTRKPWYPENAWQEKRLLSGQILNLSIVIDP